MSLSKPLRRAVLAGLVVSFGAALGACSFTPVYSGALAGQAALELAYAKPTNRLEQIIYQDLSLRFGTAPSPAAPLATVAAVSSARDILVTTTTNPSIPVEVTVTATLTITNRSGSDIPPRVYTRAASAGYTRSGQVLADRAAAGEAAERAAKGAAESLRLAVLSALSR